MDDFLLSRVACTDEFDSACMTGYAPRDIQLARCSGETLRSRRCAWLLLRQLLAEAGFDERSAGLRLLPCGKWTGKNVYVSLSHCKGYVAAAVSNRPVGIDVERLDRRLAAELYDRIATPDERAIYGDCPDKAQMLTLWTAKEAVYKMSDGTVAAVNIDTTKHNLRFTVDDYTVSCVASCYRL